MCNFLHIRYSSNRKALIGMMYVYNVLHRNENKIMHIKGPVKWKGCDIEKASLLAGHL